MVRFLNINLLSLSRVFIGRFCNALMPKVQILIIPLLQFSFACIIFKIKLVNNILFFTLLN